jgi:hypothetical protein
MLSHTQARQPIGGAFHHESLRCQATPECGNHPILIVDQQHPHTPSIGLSPGIGLSQ